METKQENRLILILSLIPYPVFPPRTGGEKAIALLNRYIAQQTKLCAVTVRKNDPALEPCYPVYNFLWNSAARYGNIFSFFPIRKLIRQHKIQWVMIEHPYMGWLGVMLQWFTPARLVVRSHNIESERWRSIGKWWWPLMYRYEGWVHRRAAFSFFIQDNDRDFAVKRYRVSPEKCTAITFGITWKTRPSLEEKKQAASFLRTKHGIGNEETIFLFAGTLRYPPNAEAVRNIVEEINPLLLKSDVPYKILICGSADETIPGENIIYTGFVSDIDIYFKGADVFINPVSDGGGIKTKLVEALGWNTKCVSTKNGAIGVEEEIMNGQLVIVEDGDHAKFTRDMLAAAASGKTDTPDGFYKEFYWGNIAGKAVSVLRTCDSKGLYRNTVSLK